MKAYARSGTPLTDADAQRYADYMVTRWPVDFPLSKEDVFEDAQNPKSPLRGFVFDRKPSEAARSYYLARARKLLQSIVVVVAEGDPPMRLFWNVRFTEAEAADDELASHQYRVELVQARPELRASIAEQARRELRQWVDKYGHLLREELGDELEAVERILGLLV